MFQGPAAFLRVFKVPAQQRGGGTAVGRACLQQLWCCQPHCSANPTAPWGSPPSPALLLGEDTKCKQWPYWQRWMESAWPVQMYFAISTRYFSHVGLRGLFRYFGHLANISVPIPQVLEIQVPGKGDCSAVAQYHRKSCKNNSGLLILFLLSQSPGNSKYFSWILWMSRCQRWFTGKGCSHASHRNVFWDGSHGP